MQDVMFSGVLAESQVDVPLISESVESANEQFVDSALPDSSTETGTSSPSLQQ
jgi:hypothetical protein